MAGTFCQIYIQTVFAVSGRESLILPSWEDELYKYITGIVQKNKQKVLAINGMPDHVHILIGMKPTCLLADLIREVKKSSSNFIKNKGFIRNGFHWQEGYGAFSYSHSSLNNVIKYIMNQKEHHRRKTFREEYIDFLNKFHVEYNPEFLFNWIE